MSASSTLPPTGYATLLIGPGVLYFPQPLQHVSLHPPLNSSYNLYNVNHPPSRPLFLFGYIPSHNRVKVSRFLESRMSFFLLHPPFNLTLITATPIKEPALRIMVQTIAILTSEDFDISLDDDLNAA